MNAFPNVGACYFMLILMLQLKMSVEETLMAKGINKYKVVHSNGYPSSPALKTLGSISGSMQCLVACNVLEPCWGFAFHDSLHSCLLFGKDGYTSKSKKDDAGYTFYGVSSWAPIKGTFSAKQSSVVKTQTPNLALDGVTCPAELPKYTPTCAVTDYVADSKKPWIEVNLQEQFIIRNLYIIGTESAPLHDVEIRVGNTSVRNTPPHEKISVNELCAFLKKHPSASDSSISCKTSAISQFISIQIINDCTDQTYCGMRKGNVLAVCEVGVNWYVTNLPNGKPTTQSSLFETYVSSNAVDGKPNTYQQTAEDTKFPWWQLDLEEDVHVAMLYISNRKDNYSARFHDVQIRVSPTDLTANLPADKPITGNADTVCASDIGKNKAITEQPYKVSCNMLGRYITLQIMKNCTGNCLAGEEALHIMNIADVVVYGFVDPKGRQPNSDAYKYKAVKIEYNQSSVWRDFGPDRITNHGKTGILLTMSGNTNAILTGGSVTPWWRVDFGNVETVHGVIIYNWGTSNLTFLHDFEVRVGDQDIAIGNFIDVIFDKNPLCAQQSGALIIPGKITLMCSESLKGRYVSIQIVALSQDQYSFMPHSNILSFCEVNVICSGKH